MILYHSSNHDFDKIECKKSGTISTFLGNEKVHREGIFLTNNQRFSSIYGKITYTIDADIKNILDLTNGFLYEDIEKLKHKLNERWMESINPHDIWNIFDGENAKLVVSSLKKIGYDSALIKEQCPKSGNIYDTYVVFDEKKLKIINKQSNIKKRKIKP